MWIRSYSRLVPSNLTYKKNLLSLHKILFPLIRCMKKYNIQQFISTILFLLFALNLLSVSVHASSQPDSLKTLIEKESVDTIKIRLMRELALSITESDSLAAGKWIDSSITLSEKINFIPGLINGLSVKATIYDQMNRYEESLLLFDSAAAKAIQHNFPKLASRSLYDAGIVCFVHSRYAEALNYFLRDLKISESIRDSSRMSILFNDIGVVYENLTDYENSILYHGKSLLLRKLLNDSAGIAMSNNNLGMVIFYKKDYLESLKFHEQSLRLRMQLNDEQGTIYSMYNISNIFFVAASLPPEEAKVIFPFTNNITDERLPEFLLDSAMSLRQSALEGAIKINDQYAKVYCMKGIGEIYVTRKQFNQALEYLGKAELEAKELGMQKELSEIYLHLHEAYSGLNRIKEALKYHKLYSATKDSVFNMQSARRIAALQTQIVVDKKEQEIELLNVKSDSQEKEIRRQKLISNMTIGGIVGFMLFSLIIYRQRNRINRERKRSDALLLNILPSETAEELKQTGSAKVRNYDSVTVMFTDFVNFAGLSKTKTPEELVNEINHCFCAFDSIISKYPIEKIKTIGDSYMCAAGLPTANTTHAFDITYAAIEIRDFMKNYRTEQLAKGRETFELRIGIHTGSVVSGIVGTKKFAYDIWGDTVNIASRMESSGEAGKVNASGTTFQIIKEKFDCEYRGQIEAKNRGLLEMYFVNRRFSEG